MKKCQAYDTEAMLKIAQEFFEIGQAAQRIVTKESYEQEPNLLHRLIVGYANTAFSCEVSLNCCWIRNNRALKDLILTICQNCFKNYRKRFNKTSLGSLRVATTALLPPLPHTI